MTKQNTKQDVVVKGKQDVKETSKGIKQIRSLETITQYYTKYGDVILRDSPDTTSKTVSMFMYQDLKELELNKDIIVSELESLQYDAKNRKRVKHTDYVSLSYVYSLELLYLLEKGKVVRVVKGEDIKDKKGKVLFHNLNKGTHNSLCFYTFKIIPAESNYSTMKHPELLKKRK